MKVAIVARNTKILPSPADSTWAPGVDMANEAKILQQLGAEVRVYCAAGSTVEGEVVDFGLDSIEAAYGALDPAQRQIRSEYYHNIYQQKVLDHLRHNPVDIIHLHDYRTYPLYENAGLNTPLVVTLHGDFFHNFEKSPKGIVEDINRMNIISVTPVPELPDGGINPPSAVLPNILELSQVPFIQNPQDSLVYVGRNTYGKGVDLAVEAALKSGNKIEIYGDISGAPEFVERLKTLYASSPSVTYQGYIPRAAVYPAFNARALLLPMREPEGLSNVVLEALAAGTPVVSFDLGGPAGIIKDGKTGFVVPAGDMDGFVAAINKIDQIDRKTCRQEVLERFDENVIGRQHLEVFEQVIKDYKQA